MSVNKIYTIQIPVPYSFHFINCYLCEEENGNWSIIDTGCNTESARLFWQKTFDQFGIKKGQVTHLYITHYHPDHIGLAGWLQQEQGCFVHMNEADWYWANAVWIHSEQHAAMLKEGFIKHGCPIALAEQIQNQFIQQKRDVLPLPICTHTMKQNDSILLGQHSFRVIKLSGHADGMVGFWDDTNKVLIAADSLLEKITPNISWWPWGNPNPLLDFFYTLQKIKTLNPSIILPGHGTSFSNAQKRIDFILQHHYNRLEGMFSLIKQGSSTAFEVASKTFPVHKLTSHQLRFAIAETLAHLEYLTLNGQLHKEEKQVKFLYCAQILSKS